MTVVRRILVLVAALLLTGCGVPVQDEPHDVTLPRQPLNITSSPAATAPSGDVAQVLCLVRDGRLVQVVRRVPVALNPQGELDQLVAGPGPNEQSRGLSTALATTALTVQLPADGTAVVEVGDAGEGAARSDEVMAYGQIVCTLTARADVGAVTFQRAGRPLQVPRGDGTLTDAPVRLSDYRSLFGPA
ncbi:GerMN domain-containing protein [Actinoplanes sp. HUAS TT8]|uniref:GerMN domain-containing protein n=1 Tax=Actinoplanes sp. HUAS TT8 TaxID=3447453 RepID=UPI003F526D34